ncbi:phosphotransferase enzyme family protein [Neobacillus sp. NPDC093127]|uniref:phosphotransferase enzyme family protein n=1 Tax=Neobacillus sp. NPDC093127 TaxID=3364296 RepID=UPI00381AD569
MFLNEMAKRYGLEAAALIQISDGYQNSVYSFSRSGGEYILRLSSGSRWSFLERQSEMKFIHALGNEGVQVSRPIPSTNRKLIEELLFQNRHVFATTFEKAPGKPVEVTDEQVWNADFFYQWGMLIGKMHSASTQLTEKFDRPIWSKDQPDLFNLIPKITSDQVRERYIQHLSKLKDFHQDHEIFGLIHNDFHQGNFFESGGRITVFDFDDCAYHWFAYDLAVSFYHAFWQTSAFTPENNQFSTIFWDHFLKGYAREHIIKKEMLQQIPIFLKIREIFLYVLFSEKWDLQNLEDWQVFTLKDLQDKIEQNIPYSAVNFQEVIDKHI